MKVLSRQEFNAAREDIYEKIMSGAVFIYPTDTIYGIGCDARDADAVRKIRRLKERSYTPFSVIAPSKDWIREHCEVSKHGEGWISRLPGPYTLIFRKKDGCVAEDVAPNLKTIGIRMPDHWFMAHIAELEIPIVTTSVNKHGEQYMTSLDDLDEGIGKGVDFVIYEGERNGRPSRLVDLSDSFKIIER